MALTMRNGSWVADFYTPEGKRIRKVLRGARSRREAERMYRQLVARYCAQHSPYPGKV